jgi:hypothetical protein
LVSCCFKLCGEYGCIVIGHVHDFFCGRRGGGGGGCDVSFGSSYIATMVHFDFGTFNDDRLDVDVLAVRARESQRVA